MAEKYEKPPCPQCGKTEFTYFDNEKHRYFCWKNPAKNKLGCGNIWAPFERPVVVAPPQPEQLTAPPFAPPLGPPPGPPQISGTPAAAPQKSVDPALKPGEPCIVFLEADFRSGVFVGIDGNNNLHLLVDGKHEVMRYWNRIVFG
jgi:hypothetical protein